jgi:hypothetical protein
MRYAWVLTVLILIAPLAEPAQKQKKQVKMQTLSGCVDEKPDVYILRSDDMLKEIATLESVGFDKTNFARFVGHKVSISGQLNEETQPPTLRVTSPDHIKNISDICAP